MLHIVEKRSEQEYEYVMNQYCTRLGVTMPCAGSLEVCELQGWMESWGLEAGIQFQCTTVG